jgi:uncharacterized protein with HEPN domain
MRSDADRVNDILEAISKIRARGPDSFEQFLSGELLQVWVIHHLQVIGEAARGISQPVKNRNSEVAWAPIIALRNILVHEYFGLNLQQVWVLTQRDLPVLEEQMRRIRDELAHGHD